MKPQAFVRANEPVQSDVLHYKLCGLENIFLRDGYEYEFIDGEQYLSVADIDGLHRAIGMHIVTEKKAPIGSELRFLRNELDMSQAELGKIIGMSDQSVARWEKGQTDVPGPGVFAIKILYLFSVLPIEKRAEIGATLVELANALAQVDEISDRAEFTFSKERWSDVAA